MAKGVDATEAVVAAAKRLRDSREARAKAGLPTDKTFESIDLGPDYEGKKIVLPSEPRPLDIDEGIEFLAIKRAENQQDIRIHEDVEAFPLEGAYAMMIAMKDLFGWASPQPTPGFWGPTPPQMISLEVGVGETAAVIWGGFKIPTIDGQLQTGVSEKGGRTIFCIQGVVKKASELQVRQLAKRTREVVKEMSIYRGKAIRLVQDEDGALDYTQPPTFLDLSTTNKGDLILRKTVEDQVETNLFTPIKYTEECRSNRVPLKRGVLMEGHYGTGKTLTAFITAQMCVNNGWTFILLERTSGLRSAVDFAKQYTPAVLFAEDIDREVGQDRDAHANEIINILDDVTTKGSEILTVLTTNHVERIHPALLRPGRLDAVITIEPPDAEAAERLVRYYGRGLIHKDENLGEAGKALDGMIPAVVREVVERSKLSAIGRGESGHFTLKAHDLVIAAEGMKNHLRLLADKPKDEATTEQRLGEAVGEVVKDQVEKVTSNGIGQVVQNLSAKVDKVLRAVRA